MKPATLSLCGAMIAVSIATPHLQSELTSIGAYQAIVDRVPRAKPEVPALGPAGSAIVDPVFGSRITRITDALTRPASPNRSYRSPSSPHQNAWSASGSYFYVVSTDGSVLPYTFNPFNGSATRVRQTGTGEGGLILNFYIEPQFSFVDDAQIYGSSGNAPRAVEQYDFNTGAYSRILDMDTVVAGLTGTYMGGIASSAGARERIVAFFGGEAQDQHHYAVVFDKSNPQQRLVLETLGSTLNGAPTSTPLNFSLHHVAMDRSGRYVMLYPTWVDLARPRKAAQSYLWDTTTGVFTPLGVSALPYGHDAFGYGVSVNQDCCVSTPWDAAQWQLRSLATPLVTRDIITSVLSPKEIYLGEHSTWNNARPDRLVPFISALYHEPASETPQRAWDDEIVAVQTDAGPGADAIVWRFAHHRSDVRSDDDPMAESFWYQPRPNVSPDGRWVMFTSNWEKSLGVDPAGDAGTRARQDVFVVELRAAVRQQSSMPFGTVDTPREGSAGSGSVGVTGWALGDAGVTGIRIYRDPVAGESQGAPIFIANATMVEGARPDVAAAFPMTPLNTRAGWGLNVLTNMLPNQGNGVYRFYAYIDDAAGQTTVLGPRTLVSSNADAVVPFGAIDTPAPGDVVAGTIVNFGWALTPQPNVIPASGSSITVLIDGASVGHPVFNNARSDIAGLFPGYRNSNGAVGYFVIDTTRYPNGVHTIAWVVRDSAGNVAGIGSRYFTIRN